MSDVELFVWTPVVIGQERGLGTREPFLVEVMDYLEAIPGIVVNEPGDGKFRRAWVISIPDRLLETQAKERHQ